MLLYVCDIWDHTLKKGHSDFVDQNKHIVEIKNEEKGSSETNMYKKYTCHMS